MSCNPHSWNVISFFKNIFQNAGIVTFIPKQMTHAAGTVVTSQVAATITSSLCQVHLLISCCVRFECMHSIARFIITENIVEFFPPVLVTADEPKTKHSPERICKAEDSDKVAINLIDKLLINKLFWTSCGDVCTS